MPPLFVPDPDGIDPQELVEQLGAELANRYAEVEDELIRQIARRAYRDLELQQLIAQSGDPVKYSEWLEANRRLAELAASRARWIREVQFEAMAMVERIRRANLAEQIVRVAAEEGEAAAIAQLRLAPRVVSEVTLTGSAFDAVGALVLDTQSRLEAMNTRITRYPQDAYQRIINLSAPMQLTGTVTSLVAQRQAVQRFLAEGVTGFIDRADRRWRIGTYAEMAGRTAASRAFETATTWRLGQAGVNLGQISGGFDACRHCAPWIGKIVSLDGTPPGPRLVPSAVADQMVTVQVHGTIEQARASRWGHPNDRCRIVGYLPGITVKQPNFEYNAQAEKDRERQRLLERRIRQAKRDGAVAGDDVTRRKSEREVKDLQRDMRDFLRETGRTRQNYREQLHFADGR
jgi:Phage minor capsid protein 2